MGHGEPWAHAELYGVRGSRGVMDQGSTFGPQGTPIPSQEEINECTPALLHILRSDPKPLPTSPQTPHVPMPPDVPAPTSPTCTSHLAFSCEALCSCRLWSTSPYPPQILPCSDPCSPVSPVPPTSLSPTSVPYTFSSSSFLTCRSHPCHSTVRLYGIWRQVGGRRGQRWAMGFTGW